MENLSKTFNSLKRKPRVIPTFKHRPPCPREKFYISAAKQSNPVCFLGEYLCLGISKDVRVLKLISDEKTDYSAILLHVKEMRRFCEINIQMLRAFTRGEKKILDFEVLFLLKFCIFK